MGAARRHHHHQAPRLPSDEKKELLDRLASECLEHTKQLGLFDQLRMRLLDSIVASNEFQKLKSEFRRELDTFCSQADLSESRAKLRERITTKTLPKSAGRLKELVLNKLVSSRRQRHEMRQLYAEQALKYIRSACLALEDEDDDDDNKREVEVEMADNASTKIGPNGSYSDSLATDSGVSSSGGGSSCSPPEPAITKTTILDRTVPPTPVATHTSPIPVKILLRNYHIPKLEKKPIDSPVEPIEPKKPTTLPPPTTTTTSANPFSPKIPVGNLAEGRWRRNKKKNNKNKGRRQRREEEERRLSRPARLRSPQRQRQTSSPSTKHITTERGPIKVI